MTLQFQCKGCRHERTEPESDHARKGYCTGCNASGIGLPQIHKVDKWQARDGSLHDTLAAAKQHQLMADLTTALRACDGYPDRQSRHLLSHFDITRKGDIPDLPESKTASVRQKFEDCFAGEFPATFEAAQRGEPKPHGDMSNAWWGFKKGYAAMLPTFEIRPMPLVKQVCKTCIFVMGAFAGAVVCVMALQVKGLIVWAI